MNNLYTHTHYMVSKSLDAVTALLQKAKQEIAEKGINEQEILEARLAPDMFPFVKQIQVVSDTAKGAMGKLTGKEIPSMEDTEASFDELIARIEKTKAFISSINTAELENADTQKIVLTYFPNKYQTAEDYVRDFVLPNLYFHFSIAYALLRMKGFTIGKSDFILKLHLKDL